MRKGEFAELAGVSAAMVSKYAKADRLVMDGSEVKPRESLLSLHGHLKEDLWKRAMARLDREERGENADAAVTAPSPSRVGDPLIDSPKIKTEHFKALTAQLEYEERIGRLVPVDEVAGRTRDLIARFYTTQDQYKKKNADMISAELGLNPVMARKFRSLLANYLRGERELFADNLSKMVPQGGISEDEIRAEGLPN